MRYLSTRGQSEPLGFKDAVRTGLARDGGLLLPETLPDLRDDFDAWRGLSYTELAFELLRRFTGDLPEAVLRECLTSAYAGFRHPEIAPVKPLGDLFLLELFHGPTLAFKDLALQFLGRLFAAILADEGHSMNIVAATSGDTGSAAIHSVRGLAGIRIFVLHPRGRVSALQERQMTTVTDANVHNLAVDGAFDDCQAIVKTLFNDLAFRDRYALGAVNSINFARILAQIVYYFYATFRVQALTGAERVQFAVPTGNFGDIFAGYLAWRMGLPIARLILATNENDILSRFFTSGVYAPRTVVSTVSPSMDIQVASNFERYLFEVAGRDSVRLRGWMSTLSQRGQLDLREMPGVRHAVFAAGRADRADTLATMREVYTQHGELLDPHTAVGVHVAGQFRSDDAPTICLATAHPAKFPDAARKALGREVTPAHHPVLDALAGKPARVTPIDADAAAVAAFVAGAVDEP